MKYLSYLYLTLLFFLTGCESYSAAHDDKKMEQSEEMILTNNITDETDKVLKGKISQPGLYRLVRS